MSTLSPVSKGFITLVIASGGAVLIDALVRWKLDRPVEFLVLLVVSVAASRMRVKLPGLTGSMSVNLTFILVAAAELSMAEALAVACLSTLAQCWPGGTKKLNAIRMLFNVGNMALAVGATRLLYTAAIFKSVIDSPQLLLAIATAGFYLLNTVPVAVVICLTEDKPVFTTWRNMIQLSFPYYLASAGVAAAVMALAGHPAWQAPVVVIPLMLGLFYSYRRYFAHADAPLPAES